MVETIKGLRDKMKKLRAKARASSVSIDTEFGQEVAYQVRNRRQELGMSQTALADLCGTGQSAINRLECGRGGLPTLSALFRVANALDCDLEIKLVAR